MSLAPNPPIGFIPTKNPAAGRAFYEHTLGLTFESEDDFAIVFRIGPARTMLRIANTPDFTPVPYTIFGWQVDDIDATVATPSSATASLSRTRSASGLPLAEHASLGSLTPTATHCHSLNIAISRPSRLPHSCAS